VDRRLAQGRRSREEILDAASRLMSQRGFEGTSIATISQESGLPNSSIYWHFGSKAAILAAVMERGAQRFFARAEPVPPPSDRPRVRLEHFLEVARQALEENEEFLRLFLLLMLSHDTPEVEAVVGRVRARGREELHRLIETAYLPAGPQVARAVADGVVDHALATFDGIFIAAQADREKGYRPDAFVQMAASVAALGDAIVAASSDAGTN
jgi:AcrR family transcriptional regulator